MTKRQTYWRRQERGLTSELPSEHDAAGTADNVPTDDRDELRELTERFPALSDCCEASPYGVSVVSGTAYVLCHADYLRATRPTNRLRVAEAPGE